jgi:hypothetical protein
MEHKALTAQDRCDRCGAQAYAKSMHSGFPLLWCAHHLRQNPQVIPDLVLDQTHLLTAEAKKPEPVER